MTTRRVTTTKTVVIGLAVALIMLGALQVSATVQADPSIETFWAKFKAAVIKGDKEPIAAMSQFPVDMPYGFPTIKTKPQLLKRYREVFNTQANAAKCFAAAKPEVDAANKNRFTVACKDEAGNEVVIYGFARTRGVWKLRSLDNINE